MITYQKASTKNGMNIVVKLENIKVPRWIGSTTPINVQIHRFADASNVAYAAVIYTRVVMDDGTINVKLISGKTKVISTPKLELQCCLLLSSLLNKILDAFKFESVGVHLYTDSTVALAWIKSHPNHWNVFVANRVTEIQQATDKNSWHYIDTKNNPADLQNHPLWWQGPYCLIKDEKHWPKHEQENYENVIETLLDQCT